VEFTDPENDDSSRLYDLRIVARLLPAELPAELRSSPKAKEVEQSLQQLKKDEREKDSVRFDSMLEDGDVVGLGAQWNTLTTSATQRQHDWSRLSTLTSTLVKLSRRDQGAAWSIWRKGLDTSLTGGRPFLIEYLTLTLPLLANLVSKETLEVIASDVLDVTSWAWR
jgi:hypothetical protein